jgi:hypothetical protein
LRRNFTITCRRSAGNIHISAYGEFNGMCAWELIKTIKKNYKSSGRVFVGTSKLEVSDPEGIDLFKNLMKKNIMPLEHLYIKGEAGFKLGPDGSRVLVNKKNRCKKRPRQQNNTKSRS